MTVTCDASDANQQWTLNNHQFVSTHNSCLDVFGAQSDAAIDEWGCKSTDSADAKNQMWSISGAQIKSQLNGQCLTVGSDAFAYAYHSTTTGKNLTFLVNMDAMTTTAAWQNRNYELAGASVVILDDDASVLFNTSEVNTTGLATQRVFKTIYDSADLRFSSWTETYPLCANAQHRSDAPTLNKSPLEQIRFTNDTSEYLIYATNFTLSAPQSNVTVSLDGRKANAYVVFIDGEYVGSQFDGNHGAGALSVDIAVSGSLSADTHSLSVISSSLGIANGMQNEQPAS